MEACPGQYGSVLEHRPAHQRASGSILGQGHAPGLQVDPRPWSALPEATDPCGSLCLPPFHSFSLKKKRKLDCNALILSLFSLLACNLFKKSQNFYIPKTMKRQNGMTLFLLSPNQLSCLLKFMFTQLQIYTFIIINDQKQLKGIQWNTILYKLIHSRD